MPILTQGKVTNSGRLSPSSDVAKSTFLGDFQPTLALASISVAAATKWRQYSKSTDAAPPVVHHKSAEGGECGVEQHASDPWHVSNFTTVEDRHGEGSL